MDGMLFGNGGDVNINNTVSLVEIIQYCEWRSTISSGQLSNCGEKESPG